MHYVIVWILNVASFLPSPLLGIPERRILRRHQRANVSGQSEFSEDATSPVKRGRLARLLEENQETRRQCQREHQIQRSGQGIRTRTGLGTVMSHHLYEGLSVLDAGQTSHTVYTACSMLSRGFTVPSLKNYFKIQKSENNFTGQNLKCCLFRLKPNL